MNFFGIDFRFWQNLDYNNIFVLAFELLLAGGWLFVFYNLWPVLKDGWLNWRQGFFARENPSVLLEVEIPEKNDRAIEAVEQVFAQLHGLRRSQNWWEAWWKGQYVLKVSFEIVSLEGHIRFFIRPTYKHKHLVEHAIYAQYPGARINEMPESEDFILLFPDKMPDKEFDMLGSEYVLAKPQYYPIKTYKEHKVNDVHIDPLWHLFELMQNLKEGEYMWYQLVLVPEDETWAQKHKKHVARLMGKAGCGNNEAHSPKSIIRMIGDHAASIFVYILLLPIAILREIYRQLFVGTGAILASQVKDHTYGEFARQIKGTGKEFTSQLVCLHEAFLSQFRKKKPTRPEKASDAPIVHNHITLDPNIIMNAPGTRFPSDYLFMSEKEKRVIDAIERKLSNQMYKTCLRTLYFAKKPVFSKFRFWTEINGVFRHFNDIDYNVWLRGPYTKTTADYFFARARKKKRQNALIFNAKGRDWYAGDEWNYLSTEELATLWHFPHYNDMQANFAVAKAEVAPPKGTALRVRPGFNADLLLPRDIPGEVPDNLPVQDFEPYNYP